MLTEGVAFKKARVDGLEAAVGCLADDDPAMLGKMGDVRMQQQSATDLALLHDIVGVGFREPSALQQVHDLSLPACATRCMSIQLAHPAEISSSGSGNGPHVTCFLLR